MHLTIFPSGQGVNTSLSTLAVGTKPSFAFLSLEASALFSFNVIVRRLLFLQDELYLLSTVISGRSILQLIKSQFRRSFVSTRASADSLSGSIPVFTCRAINLSFETSLGTEMNHLSYSELRFYINIALLGGNISRLAHQLSNHPPGILIQQEIIPFQ